jgi:hypothetical protein
MLQSKAGYIDARPLTASSAKSTCNARPDHTFGSIPCDVRPRLLVYSDQRTLPDRANFGLMRRSKRNLFDLPTATGILAVPTGV